jgi:uncharacterized protein YndB with AHSA1/START domain
VWQAVSDSQAFGRWFGVEFAGPFVAGAPLRGRMVPTQMDAEIAAMQKPYEGMAFDIFVERIEPETCIAFRWHPYSLALDVDPAVEPTTLVEFTLADAAEGTSLTITESGFDHIPLERRAAAFANNEGGWTLQLRVVGRYVDG